MSENTKPIEKQPEEDEKSSEELSDKALAEVSGGVIAVRPTEQISESVLVSSGLQDDAIHFKYDIKGNKEG